MSITSKRATVVEKARRKILDAVKERPEVLVPLLFREPDGKPSFLYAYQVPIFRAVLARRHPATGETIDSVLVKMPTGAGKSKAISMALVANGTLRPESMVNIAPRQDQAETVFKSAKDYVTRGHPAMRALVDQSQPFTNSQLSFLNTASLTCMTAAVATGGDNLLSKHFSLRCCDERALIPDAIYREKIERMNKPSGGPAFVVDISTTQKSKPPYASMKEMDEGGEYDFVHHITWRDVVQAGRWTEEWVMERRRALSNPRLFRMWYECEYAEDEEGALILAEWIERAAQEGMRLGLAA